MSELGSCHFPYLWKNLRRLCEGYKFPTCQAQHPTACPPQISPTTIVFSKTMMKSGYRNWVLSWTLRTKKRGRHSRLRHLTPEGSCSASHHVLVKYLEAFEDPSWWHLQWHCSWIDRRYKDRSGFDVVLFSECKIPAYPSLATRQARISSTSR